MKSLIIAEKPSVAADLAKALGKVPKKGEHYENDEYVISFALGHLVDDHRQLTSGDNPRLACLIPEESVATFEVMLQAHALATGERLWCSGPWPPFSFGGEPE